MLVFRLVGDFVGEFSLKLSIHLNHLVGLVSEGRPERAYWFTCLELEATVEVDRCVAVLLSGECSCCDGLFLFIE